LPSITRCRPGDNIDTAQFEFALTFRLLRAEEVSAAMREHHIRELA